MSPFDIFKTSSRHERAGEQYRSTAEGITKLEPSIERLSDEEIKQKVLQYKGKDLAEIKKHVPEIFACIREAAKRTINMRHFDVQLMGGLALLDNSISEMKTGEGKTLVATLPLIIHALTGKGAHLVTVNDYLSKRDADWMAPVYNFFDLTVGVINPSQSPAEKRVAYAADITYGTNNEFGFDYLRDNMAPSTEELVQRGLHYAIVDEVDSILIDEARTPLIISAPDSESTKMYQQFAQMVPQLKEDEHYNVDEKRRAATLTDEGVSYIEKLLGIENIYEERGIRMVHHLEQALRAQTLYHRDKDYVVRDGQVMIVDEFTGRMMEGRRYSEGLHQAIEAKERVPVQQESRTLATITFQNFFRLYENLAGMTGTAVTSAEEFEKVYNLEVVVIPTNKEMVRRDMPDYIYGTEEAKFLACIEEIKKRHEKGQPVLVGTIAIEKSEFLSALLQRQGIPHEVLNAKQHAREAEIVARAGQKGAVTISTNMAGRGTDIKLGEEVPSLGGLFVMGTERHEARRIDNQLRGRSGRQGDPGETRFFVSLEDDVMRIFGGQKIKGIMERLKIPKDQPIESAMVSRALEKAQERVEGYYFDMRKQVLSYDDVLNRQRNAIYTLRRNLLINKKWKEPELEPEDLYNHIESMLGEQAAQLVSIHTADREVSNWNLEEIAESIASLTGQPVSELHGSLDEAAKAAHSHGPDAAREDVVNKASEELKKHLALRREKLGNETFENLAQAASIRSIDTFWMEHLDTMDYLRTGIGLRGYGQRDPLVEYQKEGYRLFQELLNTIKGALVEIVFKAEAVRQEQNQGVAEHAHVVSPQAFEQAHATVGAPQQRIKPSPAGESVTASPYKGVGRNDLCPCGSGKKFKKCHGAE